MNSRPHTWRTITSTDLIIEERCDRCERRRWRQPEAARWYYSADPGVWILPDIEPPCSNTEPI